MAQVHKGEVFSGDKNQMGFGADMTETNKLLKKQLTETILFREQNKKDMTGLGNRIKVLELTNF